MHVSLIKIKFYLNKANVVWKGTVWGKVDMESLETQNGPVLKIIDIILN